MSNLRSQLQQMKRDGEARIYAIASNPEVVKCKERKCKYETQGSLMMHVVRIHKLNRDQYLAKHNLPHETRLYGAKYGKYLREASNILNYHKNKKGKAQ